jgi:large conductance mechanosensitive channel
VVIEGELLEAREPDCPDPSAGSPSEAILGRRASAKERVTARWRARAKKQAERHKRSPGAEDFMAANRLLGPDTSKWVQALNQLLGGPVARFWFHLLGIPSGTFCQVRRVGSTSAHGRNQIWDGRYLDTGVITISEVRMIKEFKDFVMRGNVLDLAVAVVLGAAFGAVVAAFVDSLIMPFIAMLFGQPNFDDLTFTVNNSVFGYGSFLTALVNFILVAGAIFFFVVKPVSVINEHTRTEEAATERECPDCLSEVPIKATRCAYCTSELTPTG